MLNQEAAYDPLKKMTSFNINDQWKATIHCNIVKYILAYY